MNRFYLAIRILLFGPQVIPGWTCDRCEKVRSLNDDSLCHECSTRLSESERWHVIMTDLFDMQRKIAEDLAKSEVEERRKATTRQQRRVSVREVKV